ncbi:MAG: phosphotransferase [Pseudomonadales bacterium]|nr:phosphotransferase [Pseudomonadales bacterium]
MMEAGAIAAYTNEVRAQIFETLGKREADLTDLNGFESFVYLDNTAGQILRITHHSHRSPAMLEAELQLLELLSAAGAGVSRGLPVCGEPLLTVGDFTVCCFEPAQGQLITQADWHPALFSAWGQAIGRMHRIVAAQPASRMPARYSWREDQNTCCLDWLPADQPLVRARAASLLAKLDTLPAEAGDFGLIHCDAHAGNFHVRKPVAEIGALNAEDYALTFFDFDDACYHWFAFDIATIFFSAVRQAWIADTDAAQREVAEEFVPAFLSGYRQLFPLSDFTVRQLPLFLQLREISLYAVLNFHEDHGGGDFGARFMAGRRARIEAGIPVLDLSGLL